MAFWPAPGFIYKMWFVNYHPYRYRSLQPTETCSAVSCIENAIGTSTPGELDPFSMCGCKKRLYAAGALAATVGLARFADRFDGGFSGGMDEHYSKDVDRTPVMSKQEEASTAEKYRSSGDIKYRNRLVEANLRFVVGMAGKYKKFGFPLQDLIQVGNLGLIRAAEKHDPSRNARLISHARWWIRAYIHEYIFRNWSPVKMSSSDGKRVLFRLMVTPKWINEFRLMELNGGREKAEQWLTDKTGMSAEDVEEFEIWFHDRLGSLDAPMNDTVDPTFNLQNTLALPGDTPEDELVRSGDEELFQWALDRLAVRERTIIEGLYLANEPVTLAALGEQLGVSKERVRQISEEALQKLRKVLNEPDPAIGDGDETPKALQAKLESRLAGLDDRKQEIITLKFLGGRSRTNHEIAEMLGIPKRLVIKLVEWAILKLGMTRKELGMLKGVVQGPVVATIDPDLIWRAARGGEEALEQLMCAVKKSDPSMTEARLARIVASKGPKEAEILKQLGLHRINKHMCNKLAKVLGAKAGIGKVFEERRGRRRNTPHGK